MGLTVAMPQAEHPDKNGDRTPSRWAKLPVVLRASEAIFSGGQAAEGLGVLRNSPAVTLFEPANGHEKLELNQVPWFPLPEDSDPAGEYVAVAEFNKILAELPETCTRSSNSFMRSLAVSEPRRKSQCSRVSNGSAKRQ